MRCFLVFSLLLSSGSVFAANLRVFVCNATDSLDRKSRIELNVDTGNIRMKDANIENANWQIVYSREIGCTHKVPYHVACTRHLKHSLDYHNKLYAGAIDRIRCFLNGRPEVQFDGDLEINRFGDGTGKFVCGTLTKYNLLLEGCKLAEQ